MRNNKATNARVVQQDVTFEVNLLLHPAQEEIVNSQARFKVVAAGRRFGKTMLAAAMVVIKALSTPDMTIWWISPSHQQSRIALRLLEKFIPLQYREVNRTLGEVYLVNGSTIATKSGERFNNLRGEGLDMVVIDEAAFLEEGVWSKAIRPALADKNGSAILISTFDGENWFYDLYLRGKSDESKEWQSWLFTTASNPFVPSSEIVEMERTMPHDVFMQEVKCVPLVFVGAVFEGEQLAMAIDRGDFAEVPQGALVEAGLDWGWNYTALEVCAELKSGEIIWLYEQVFRNVELNERCMEISNIAKEMNIQTIYADAAGASENVTLARVLDRINAPTFVQPVPFNMYKDVGINTRRFYLKQNKEVLTQGCPQLIRDSKLYAYDESGKPKKVNDHTVDAATAFYASRSDVLGEEFGMRDAGDEYAV